MRGRTPAPPRKVRGRRKKCAAPSASQREIVMRPDQVEENHNATE